MILNQIPVYTLRILFKLLIQLFPSWVKPQINYDISKRLSTRDANNRCVATNVIIVMLIDLSEYILLLFFNNKYLLYPNIYHLGRILWLFWLLINFQNVT